MKPTRAAMSSSGPKPFSSSDGMPYQSMKNPSILAAIAVSMWYSNTSGREESYGPMSG